MNKIEIDLLKLTMRLEKDIAYLQNEIKIIKQQISDLEKAEKDTP